MSGIERIAAERRRQIEKEGWTPDEARKHWRGHRDPQRQSVVLPTLEAALAIARAQGWKGAEGPCR